jgi:hypothetical protein
LPSLADEVSPGIDAGSVSRVDEKVNECTDAS